MEKIDFVLTYLRNFARSEIWIALLNGIQRCFAMGYSCGVCSGNKPISVNWNM